MNVYIHDCWVYVLKCFGSIGTLCDYICCRILCCRKEESEAKKTEKMLDKKRKEQIKDLKRWEETKPEELDHQDHISKC
jgi:hypothetical protein